jgi:hypothetical protein
MSAPKWAEIPDLEALLTGLNASTISPCPILKNSFPKYVIIITYSIPKNKIKITLFYLHFLINIVG